MEWNEFAAGLSFGAAISLVFFAGLGVGVRVACRAARPGAVLLVSAILRVTLLLLAGWSAAQMGLWSGIGFAAAFLIVRFVSIAWARAPVERERT